MNRNLETWAAIHQIFDEHLPATPPEAEEEMMALITHRVSELMRSDMGLLLSHLYRLDVDERKVDAVLSNPSSSESVERDIALLIWERQKKRIQTKALFKRIASQDIPDDYKW